MQQSRQSGSETALSFLPTISFVHSLPPRGDWCTELARRSCDWSKNLTLTDGRPLKQIRPTTADGRSVYVLVFFSLWRPRSLIWTIVILFFRNDYQSFLSGISSEKEAGWPFHSFLEKYKYSSVYLSLCLTSRHVTLRHVTLGHVTSTVRHATDVTSSHVTSDHFTLLNFISLYVISYLI